MGGSFTIGVVAVRQLDDVPVEQRNGFGVEQYEIGDQVGAHLRQTLHVDSHLVKLFQGRTPERRESLFGTC